MGKSTTHRGLSSKPCWITGVSAVTGRKIAYHLWTLFHDRVAPKFNMEPISYWQHPRVENHFRDHGLVCQLHVWGCTAAEKHGRFKNACINWLTDICAMDDRPSSGRLRNWWIWASTNNFDIPLINMFFFGRASIKTLIHAILHIRAKSVYSIFCGSNNAIKTPICTCHVYIHVYHPPVITISIRWYGNPTIPSHGWCQWQSPAKPSRLLPVIWKWMIKDKQIEHDIYIYTYMYIFFHHDMYIYIYISLYIYIHIDNTVYNCLQQLPYPMSGPKKSRFPGFFGRQEWLQFRGFCEIGRASDYFALDNLCLGSLGSRMVEISWF